MEKKVKSRPLVRKRALSAGLATKRQPRVCWQIKSGMEKLWLLRPKTRCLETSWRVLSSRRVIKLIKLMVLSEQLTYPASRDQWLKTISQTTKTIHASLSRQNHEQILSHLRRRTPLPNKTPQSTSKATHRIRSSNAHSVLPTQRWMPEEKF